MPQTDDRWSASRWASLLTALTATILVTHGFHPLAEDGGLYVAGIKWLIHPELYPHDRAFVQEHLSFSLFAPSIAAVIHFTHIPLLWMLLLTYLLSSSTTLAAAKLFLQNSGFSDRAQLAGTALLAAWWTIPVAGTSLLLMDPYVTARSLSTPLGLLALALSLRKTRRSLVLSIAALILAGAFHPLMAAYAAALVVFVLLPSPYWLTLTFLGFAIAAVFQFTSQPETPAAALASYSRYYWFLSQWRWFELIGLAGPPLVLLVLVRRTAHRRLKNLVHAAIALCAIATLIALIFAQEHFVTHAVARLQPLRVFLQIYALLALLLGATLIEKHRAATIAIIVASFIGFAILEHETYPASARVELPAAAPRNPWAQAFLWARANTPSDALFALDAKYINTDGEDAQTFRAIAERSALPDFSKDGGEAAITHELANEWLAASTAQSDISALSDIQRDSQLAPFAPTWVVLHATSNTAHPCPYKNSVVKVCRLR